MLVVVVVVVAAADGDIDWSDSRSGVTAWEDDDDKDVPDIVCVFNSLPFHSSFSADRLGLGWGCAAVGIQPKNAKGVDGWVCGGGNDNVVSSKRDLL